MPGRAYLFTKEHYLSLPAEKLDAFTATGCR